MHLLAQLVRVRYISAVDRYVMVSGYDRPDPVGEGKASFLSDGQSRCRTLDLDGVMGRIGLEVAYRLFRGFQLVRRNRGLPCSYLTFYLIVNTAGQLIV